jgi:hypothetical protein
MWARVLAGAPDITPDSALAITMRIQRRTTSLTAARSVTEVGDEKQIATIQRPRRPPGRGHVRGGGLPRRAKHADVGD